MATDARTRFVEMMRRLPKFGGTGLLPLIHQAVEAFADESCHQRRDGYNAGLDSVSACEGYQDITVFEHDHTACRAALLKEVFDV